MFNHELAWHRLRFVQDLPGSKFDSRGSTLNRSTRSVFVRKALLMGALILGLATGSPSALSAGLPWSLNDVTILYPLPSQTSLGSAVSSSPTADSPTPEMIPFVDSSYGSKHLEIGDSLIAALGSTGQTPLLDVYQLQQLYRVVGVRFDPCFRDHFTDSCQRQIRLSWQPIVQYSGKWMALDATIHTFYTLSNRDWQAMLAELDVLRSRYARLTENQPLQPHPALVREGLRGPFATGLRKLLSKYANWERLSRVAKAISNPKSPNNGAPGILWEFAMAVSDGHGALSQAAIPNVSSSIYGQGNAFEVIGNMSRDGKSFIPVVLSSTGNQPVASTLNAGVENILPLINGNLDPKNPSHQQALALLYQSSLRILQPTLHLPGTTDCVSCHMASSAGSWLARNLPQNTRAPIEQSVIKTWGLGRHNLKNVSPASADTRSIRGLGYVGNFPSISARVIFESAVVADALSRTD